MEGYRKTVYTGAEGEIVEKKSRFIATIRPVETEEDAISFIEGRKKKHYNASHNCFAFVIGQKHEIIRCSDDGEPSGTAGRPMLDVLLSQGLHNVAVVVTRYFGGTLLGTGGLVRAYSKAVQEGLKNSIIITKEYAVKLMISTDYSGIGKVQYQIGRRNLQILQSEYTQNVQLLVLVPHKDVDSLFADITEATCGQAAFERKADVYYTILDGEILLFD